jgi:hypothetical protein
MVNCTQARKDARDFANNRWATLLTPKIFKEICGHVQIYEDESKKAQPDPAKMAAAKQDALDVIMVYGYSPEQADDLLFYGFPTIIPIGPGSRW